MITLPWSTGVDTLPGSTKPGFFRRLASWWGPRPLGQLALILGVLAIFWWFGTNTAATLDRVGISPGFAFLERSANFEIGETMIAYRAGDTYARAILAGLLNTMKVALIGCFLATALGVALGVARLSGNLLLANLVRWYVEVVRNVPLLLQLFFWSALAHALPPPRHAVGALGAQLTNRGIFVPAVSLDGAAAPAGMLLTVLALGAGVLVVALRRRLGLAVRAGILAGAAGLAMLAVPLTGAALTIELPQLAGFNIRGGWMLTPEFAALLAGLVVKFSASIAEIVRAGIESVGRGQWEAARALGLHPGQIMRLVVLPQALRVITPLLTSSYLDLTKDSSLAVAIGYPDLVNVINTTANTTGQSLEALAILVMVYLALNLSVSALMNLYNSRVALRGEARH